MFLEVLVQVLARSKYKTLLLGRRILVTYCFEIHSMPLLVQAKLVQFPNDQHLLLVVLVNLEMRRYL